MAAAPSRKGVPLKNRLGPHVFLVCFTLLAVSVLASWALPKVTGDKVFSGPLDSGEPVDFTVAGGSLVHFHLAHRFPDYVGPGQNATLAILDSSGNEVFNESASVGSLGKNKDERDQQVFPSIPPWRPESGGAYRAVYTYINGTPSEEHLVVVEGGWRLREGPGNLFYLTLAPTTAVLFVALFFVSPVDGQAEGWRRFYPVRGATRNSLLGAIAVGLALTAVFLYIVGGGPGGY